MIIEKDLIVMNEHGLFYKNYFIKTGIKEEESVSPKSKYVKVKKEYVFSLTYYNESLAHLYKLKKDKYSQGYFGIYYSNFYDSLYCTASSGGYSYDGAVRDIYKYKEKEKTKKGEIFNTSYKKGLEEAKKQIDEWTKDSEQLMPSVFFYSYLLSLTANPTIHTMTLYVAHCFDKKLNKSYLEQLVQEHINYGREQGWISDHIPDRRIKKLEKYEVFVTKKFIDLFSSEVERIRNLLKPYTKLKGIDEL